MGGVNTIEEDNSDADFLEQIMRPKSFQKHKGFVTHFTAESSATRSDSRDRSISPDYMSRMPFQLPDLPQCDFVATGCERFDKILSLKEDANKKR